MFEQIMKKALQAACNLFVTVILIAMVVVVAFMVKGKLDGGVPSVGPYSLYVVLSGSMEPTFYTGSIVGVARISPEQVQNGDVVTFRNPEDEGMIITHRVRAILRLDNGQTAFMTKGDANNAPDAAVVPGANLIGREVFAIPYAGYVTNFSGSKQGLLVLIIIPALLVISMEMKNLWKLAAECDAEEKSKQAATLEKS